MATRYDRTRERMFLTESAFLIPGLDPGIHFLQSDAILRTAAPDNRKALRQTSSKL
jgi:hypothetical protein